MILPFASLTLCAAVVVMVFLPETAGLALHETIDEAEGVVPSHELRPLSSGSPTQERDEKVD
jgi:hypothetical protein